jgi:DNA-binding FadR family transcriptional regulator
MEFKALKKEKTLAQKVEDQILTHIISGKLRPGDYLPVEAQLAKSFEIGKSTIREALRSLESREIINVVPRKGVCIRKIPTEHMEESDFEFQLNLGPAHVTDLLEALPPTLACCAWMACKNRDVQDLDKLYRILDSLAECVDRLKTEKQPEPSDKKYESEYFRFYRALSNATHNKLIKTYTTTFLDNLSRNLPLAEIFFIRNVREAQMLLLLDMQVVSAIDDQNCGVALTLGLKKAQGIERVIKMSMKL